MTEDKPIRCDECGQIVGMLTKNAHGSREEIVTGNDANCDYPPVVTCPDARLAFSRARRIEVLEEMQEQSVQDRGASRDHKAPRRPKVTSSRTK